MMNWKRSTALLSSGLILSFMVYKVVLACSDGPSPYDYYPQFFRPPVKDAPQYLPFHYTGWIKYYDEYFEGPQDSVTIPDANLKEWSAYTGGRIPQAELDSFIYAFPYGSLSSLYYNIEKSRPLKLRAAEAANGLTKWFQQGKDLEALGYLMYAKQCEPETIPKGSWEAPPADTAKRGRLLRNGLQLHTAAKQDFIRERYAYQVLRLSFLNESYGQTLELYTTLIGDAKKAGTEIFYRCLGYKAGALFRLNRKAEAAYNYALVFDGSDGLKKSAYTSFEWATTRDKKPVLALCKTPHEKAVVHLMDGLNNYEQALPQLKAAYAADPAVKGLDILFTREINKAEERYQQDQLLKQRNLNSDEWYYQRYFGESRYQSEETTARLAAWKTYVPQLIAFGKQVVADGKAVPNGFWRLGTAYLYAVNNEFDKAKAELALATDAGLSVSQRSQREVIRAIVLIRSAGRMDAGVEAALLPELRRIEGLADRDPGYAKIYRDLMGTVVATAYLQNRDTVKAVYALGRIDKYGDVFQVSSEYLDLPGILLERMSIPKLQELQAYYSAGAKSDWDRWLLRGSAYTPANLQEFEGTKYLRSNQWAKAITVLQKLPDSVKNSEAFLDPFVVQVPDLVYPDSTPGVSSYSKLQFAKEMSSLQAKTDAAGMFRYGCGLYNMSYYGWSNRAFAYFRSTTDELGYYTSPERQALPKEFQEYYGVMAAEGYFRQAAGAATEKELKARALWMAAKCWQKRCPLPIGKQRWEFYSDTTYYHNAMKNPYFERLEKESANAAFYQEVSTECSYFADFARKR